MSKKTLNTANLKALGAERLADLLMEVSTGSADIKRRLRLELSHNLGASELAREVRKRLVSLGKSRSFVGWRKRKALIKDLDTQLMMILEKIAPEDPATAFELLWQFVEIAPSIYERVDDSRGDVGAVFRAALGHFDELGLRALRDPVALADQVWTVVQDNGYGEWDGIISRLAPSLGAAGLARLKQLVEEFATAPAEEEPDTHEAIRFLRDLRGGRDYAAERRQRFVQSCLQEIAAAAGDRDAYIALYTPDDLMRAGVAAEVALLLLEDGRAEEAFDLLQGADMNGPGQRAWNTAFIAALEALGRQEEAQAHRWACFQTRLSAPHLRDFLKRLPDFEDVEAEDRARTHVLGFPDFQEALAFCLDWPDLVTAAQLVEARAGEIDGNHYALLTPAAEALRGRHPLAATLLWRAMIDFTLHHGRASRYGHAAEHLEECAAVNGEIMDFGGFAGHDTYVEALQAAHARKASFWAKLR